MDFEGSTRFSDGTLTGLSNLWQAPCSATSYPVMRKNNGCGSNQRHELTVQLLSKKQIVAGGKFGNAKSSIRMTASLRVDVCRSFSFSRYRVIFLNDKDFSSSIR
ncbi:predicted protein [Histoplasma capsulatum var. duboisii H88]|uniref:Predicted protein n=2 Tax=Ajellomyces capsulatus TaxID=5037 RepID=F0U786_AJEC8|nr:predicted protein [Histoplasma capsulatum H143]EGC41560.1 predicted protein [Histoplasma capsulatum var. duboisii H88]